MAKRLATVANGIDPKTLSLKVSDDDLTNGRIVFDDEDVHAESLRRAP
jgi:hypothetical protein